MTRRKRLNLWVALVVAVFLIMLSSSMIMLLLALLLTRLELVSFDRQNTIVPTLFFLFTSVAVGTGITTMVGKRILAPVTDVIEATKEVAKGNFKIELDEAYKIDELNKMAKNFNRMVQELNSIETLRNDFIINVSHEFKTPIAAIEGYAALLRDNHLSGEEYTEYTQMIIESAQQLSALSSNILKISKLENQDIIAEKSRFRLDEQIRQALLLLEMQWSDKNITLNIELAPVTVYGNEELLMQVWLNLLGNALKFTPPGGEVSVSLAETEGVVIVKITDTGIGMPKEVQKHIFEKFYQGDKARAYAGNGLGLPLVKRILDLCGSSIHVESQPGIGSSFTVTLPQT